jgi:hypothetical protein
MAKIIIENQKQLNELIRQNVIEVIREMLNDPDFGLELREWVKKRLRKKPKKLIPFEEVKKKCL